MIRALALVLVLCASTASTASAQRGDGVYRRFDHDLALVFGVGGAIVLADEDEGALVLDLRARVIDAGGLVLSYRWGAESESQIFAGFELKPFWPALFLTSSSTHREWLDLFLQSFGVELGVAMMGLGADGDNSYGLGIGVSLEVPLSLPSRTRGAFQRAALRLAARRVDATRSYLGTDDARDRSEWSVLATLQIVVGVRANTFAEPARYRY